MPWVIEADGKAIGMTVWDKDSQEHRLLEDGERKIIMTGGSQDVDGAKLAQEFCEKYVIPGAMRHGVSTQQEVIDRMGRQEWRQIIDIFMDAPADMFWPPDELWIYNDETDEKYYPHSHECTGEEHELCGRCTCHCDCIRRDRMAREAEQHAARFAEEQAVKRDEHNAKVDAEMDLIQAKMALSEKLRAEGKTPEEIFQALEEFDEEH